MTIMKKIILLLAFVLAVVNASASVSVCDTYADENDGHFSSPFIKSGTISWDETSKTLTLDNAVVEYSSDTPTDNVYALRVTEDATIVVHGDCKLTTTGYIALGLDGVNSKSVTIQGDGRLDIASLWLDVFLVATYLTIKDITLQTSKSIANNSTGTGVALTFDNVQAIINGNISRIGDGITFKDCSITYPEDAYIADSDYGQYIACGNDESPDHIVISRSSLVPGDVNSDLEVNIADVNAVIDVILSDANNPAADVNGDGEINIADINAVIDIILGGGPTPPSDTEIFTVNGVSFKMVGVEGGTFTMGATAEQGSDAYDDEKPAHQVTLSSFIIGQTEVTQALWQAVMGSNPSYFTGDLSRPVEQVSWNDCQTFITRLNELTGKQFRLPTEAEWEYAARGGNQSQGYKYAGSNTIDDVAWYDNNSYALGSSSPDFGTHAVATKASNELGLYDMSGNVYEWCLDFTGDYSSEAQTNPTGPTTGSYRVFRGGGWNGRARYCRVSCRGNRIFPESKAYSLGLRLAL